MLLGLALTVASACGGGESPVVTATTTTAAPTTTVPATTTTVRAVARGETFSVRAGETVLVSGVAVSVTFRAVTADNRCPPGRQCITGGNATVSVTVRKDGTAPADLTLNTDEGSASARYATFRVELVGLGFGANPVARLRVS